MTRLQLWLLQLAGIVIAAVIAYAWADGRGYERCKAEQAAATAKANVDLVGRERQRDKESDVISGRAEARANDAAKDAAGEAAEAEGRIKIVYRDRWRDPEPGRCAIPLDPRVQSEIDAAVRRSNEET